MATGAKRRGDEESRPRSRKRIRSRGISKGGGGHGRDEKVLEEIGGMRSDDGARRHGDRRYGPPPDAFPSRSHNGALLKHGNSTLYATAKYIYISFFFLFLYLSFD